MEDTIADQYEPLIQTQKTNSIPQRIINGCLFPVVVMFALLALAVMCIFGNWCQPVKIPVKLDKRLTRLLPINSTVKFSHDGTDYELVFEPQDDSANHGY